LASSPAELWLLSLKPPSLWSFVTATLAIPLLSSKCVYFEPKKKFLELQTQVCSASFTSFKIILTLITRSHSVSLFGLKISALLLP
jgi:hypothetical protein